MTHIQSKSDRDRVRQKASGNRATLDRIKGIVREYAQGRAAISCMADIIKALKGARS